MRVVEEIDFCDEDLHEMCFNGYATGGIKVL